jgi:hypothetical protein
MIAFTKNRGEIEEIRRVNNEEHGFEKKEKTLIFSKIIGRWGKRFTPYSFNRVFLNDNKHQNKIWFIIIGVSH